MSVRRERHLAANEGRKRLRVYAISDDLDDDERAASRAKRPSWWLLGVGLCGAALMTTALIPRDVQRQSLRDDPSTRQAALEARVAGGEREPAMMLELARLRLGAGDAAAALNWSEQTLKSPALDARTRIAASDARVQALIGLQRLDEAETLVDDLQRESPGVGRQRWLVRARQAARDEAGTLRALGTLVLGLPAAAGKAEPDEFRDLAERLMARQAPRPALLVLEALAEVHPGQERVEDVLMQVSAVDAIGAAEPQTPKPVLAADALERARAWLSTPGRPVSIDAPKIAQALDRAGMQGASIALLEPWLGNAMPEVSAAWTRSMQQAGRGMEAMQTLAKLASKGDRDEWLRQRVKLALESQRLDHAIAAVREQGMAPADAQAVTSLVQAMMASADANNHLGTLKTWWSEGLAAKLGPIDPVLAAHVAQAVGDHGASLRFADAATAQCQNKPSCAVRLAHLNHTAGRGREALAALKLVDDVDIDEPLLSEYATTAIGVGYGREAFAKIERQRKSVSSAMYSEAWSLLAMQSGRYADVSQWLATSPKGEVSQSTLKRIFKGALDAKAHALAALAAERMDTNALKAPDLVMLAHGLMELGRTTDALNVWRQVRVETKAYDEAYVTVLTQALERGAGGYAENELVQLLIAQVQSAKPSEARDALVQRLVDLKAHARIVDVLESMAQQDPGRWWAAYEIAAVKSGQSDRLTAARRKAALSPLAPAAMRSQWARDMLGAGERQHAEPVLRELALHQLPSGADAKQLLQLWGDRPTGEQLDWMQSRAATWGDSLPKGAVQRASLTGSAAQSQAAPALDGAASQALRGLRAETGEVGANLVSTDEARAAWMRELNARGGANRTVATYRRMNPLPTNGPIFERYVEALERMTDRQAPAMPLRERGR